MLSRIHRCFPTDSAAMAVRILLPILPKQTHIRRATRRWFVGSGVNRRPKRQRVTIPCIVSEMPYATLLLGNAR